VGEKTILFVGRLAREKGIEILLKSFAELARTENAFAGWKLRIVGPPQRPGPAEVEANPRARSAVLRVAEKLS